MNKSNPPRLKFGLVFLLLLSTFWLIPVLFGSLYYAYPVTRYLLFHTVAEILSAVICFSIFSIVWYTSRQKHDLPGLVMGCFFLIIGTLETLHWLSYPGLPNLITVNVTDKSFWYMMFTKYATALALLSLSYIPQRHYTLFLRRGIFAASVGIILSVSLIINATNLLPALFTPDGNPTTFKTVQEAFFMGIYMLALLIIWHRYDRRSEINHTLLLYALELMVFSQGAMFVHKSLQDIFYVLGHIYRLLGYLIIYRALFVSAIQKPYRELERVEETYKNLFEAANDLIYILDDQEHILNVNTKGAELLGIAKEEILGKTFDFLIYEEDLPAAREAYWRTLKGQNVDLELRVRTSRDGVRHFIFKGFPWYEKGQVVGSQGIARDITDRIQMERQLTQTEKLSLLGKMAATIAHEVNNPLWHMRLELEDLQDRLQDNTPAVQSLQMMDKEIDRLAGIVRQLQAFARPDYIKKKKVRLNDILESDIIGLTLKHMKIRGINIEKALQPGLPPVLGSEDQLTQVFLNIVKNADDVLPKGGWLKIASLANEDTVRVEISDNGPGISQENMQRMFEPFFTTKGKYGTGLGLAISHKIIKGHGGEILCESQLGQGSVFTVKLPVYKETGA